MRRAVLVVLACSAVAACTSPEARRQRGGGPGADPGNRPAQVKMHEGSRQYWDTPVRIEDVKGPPLAPSEQARRLDLTSSSSASASKSPGSGGG